MKKRLLSLLLVLMMVLGLLPTGALAADSVTVISTAEEFAAMNSSGNYKLGADIEVTEPYAQFGGTFDSDGHTVTLKLNTSSNNAALFGRTNRGAVIKNLLVNAQVTASGYGSSSGTAGLVGQVYGATTIENCGVTGTVTNIYSGYSSVNAGGLVGYLYDNLTLINCYSTADVTAKSTSYSSAVGGLVGGADSSYTLTASNCYAAGTVAAGGDSVKKVGGFAGSLSKSSLSNCYYNSAVSNGALSGLSGKTAEELKGLADALGDGYLADTSNINGGYPILSCQYFNPNATYTVTIQVTPADSVLTWAGAEQAASDGVYTFTGVAVGEHPYTVTNEAGDYAQQSGTITVRNKDVTQAVSLELNPHSLAFTLDPADAALVVMDSAQTVLTPVTGTTYTVINGTYGYGASKFGYEDTIGTVQVNKGDLTQAVTLTAKPAHTVTFAYGAAPDGGDVQGASLTVTTGEQVMEATGDMTHSLPVGYDYTYTFKSANYATVTGNISLSGVTEAGSQTVTIPLTIKTAWGGADDISEPVQADGVYQISSGSELAWLAQEVNAGRGTSYRAVLTRNIDLGDEEWTPIGKTVGYSGYPYSGAFDGQGHTISGLSINRTTGNEGLFGYVKDAVIRNLTVDGKVNGGGSGTTSGVGGLIGTLDGTSGAVLIENCVNRATVSGSTNVAGIAGLIKGGGAKIIRSCVNLGTIQAGASTGGIVGNFYYKCTVEDCYNRGAVSATNNAGGVAGLLNDSGAAVKRCYTTTATAIGKKSSGTVEKSTVFCQGSDPLATTVTESELKAIPENLGPAFVADSTGINNGYPTLDFQVTKYPVTFTVTPAEAQVVIPGAVGEHKGSTWTFQLPAGEYSYAASLFGYLEQSGKLIVTDSAVTETVTLTEAAKKEVTFAVSPQDANAAVTVTWNGEPVSPKSGATFELPYGDYHYLIKARGYAKAAADFTVDASSPAEISVTLEPSTAWDGAELEVPEGQGSQANPYQIENGAQLAWLANQVNSGSGSVHAKLTGDIDLGEQRWTPIGQYPNNFSGSLDGQGFTVSGLKVAGADYAGLFGYIKGSSSARASVCNLVVQGSVSGSADAGGIAGRADYTDLTNCGNEAEITGTGSSTNAGGIVGRQQSYNAGITIQGCYNTGAVTAYRAGGIIASINDAADITNCYNTGTITGNSYAGGIRGQYGSFLGTVTNCYHAGTVAGGTTGPIQASSTSGTMAGCYYLSDASGEDGAVTAVEMTTALLGKLNGSTEPAPWKQDVNTNKGYPILAWQRVSAPPAADLVLAEGEFIWARATDPDTGEEIGEITPYFQWKPMEDAKNYTLTLWNQCFRPTDGSDDPYTVIEEWSGSITVSGTPATQLPDTLPLDAREGWLYADLENTIGALQGEGRYYVTVTPEGEAVPTLDYVRENIFGYETPYNRLAPVSGLHWDGSRACWTPKASFGPEDSYAVTVYKRDSGTGELTVTSIQSVPGNYSRVDCSGTFAIGGQYVFSVAALATNPVMESLNYYDSLESRLSHDAKESGDAGIYTVQSAVVPGGEHGEDWIAISSAADWIALANTEDSCTTPGDQETNLQRTAWGKKYYLTADLDFSKLSTEDAAKTKSIGSVTNRFTGTLDGNGHKITGLTLSNGDLGLFNYIGASGCVYGLTVEGANVLASDNAGVVAHNNYGLIENCAVKNTNITTDTGAVIGGMVSRNYGIIRNSYVEGGELRANSTYATSHAGFAGANEYGGLIERCWTSMDVISASDYAGGFVGQCYGETGNPSMIRDCFALGNVQARSYSGGFAGRSAYEDCHYENCYAAGTISGESNHGFIGGNKPDSGFQYNQAAGITNCYYNAASPADDNATGGKTLEEMATAAFVQLLNRSEEIWTRAEDKNDGLPYLKAVKAPEKAGNQTITVEIALAVYDKASYSFSQLGDTITVTMASNGNTRVVDLMDAAQAQGLLSYSYDTTPTFGRYIHTINGKAVEAPDGWMFTINDQLSNVSASLSTVSDGAKLLWFEGTTENRFLPLTWAQLSDSNLDWVDIDTVEQLMALTADDTDLSLNYRLNADLDLTNVPFPGIGSAARPFTGIFDGQGHTVSNVSINGTENVGFFNVLQGGTVKNLHLKNVGVFGTANVGALVGASQAKLNTQDTGANLASLVGSCSVSGGRVSGSANVGGLVGLNGCDSNTDAGLSTSSSVDKCSADITVQGSGEKIGGLVGANNGVITHSAATGTVEAGSAAMVGGLAGDNSGSIYDSHAGGTVTGKNVVGGFVGSSGGSITRCYSLGNVNGSGSNVGGFAGTLNAADTVIGTGTVQGSDYVGGLAGSLSGQLVGVSSQINVKQAYGNCSGGVSVIGNTSRYSGEGNAAALAGMSLSTQRQVADKLYELFGVNLGAGTEMDAELEKYADSLFVPNSAEAGSLLTLLKGGETPNEKVSVSYEVSGELLSGGEALTLLKQNAGQNQTVEVVLILTGPEGAIVRKPVTVAIQGKTVDQTELMDTIAAGYTGSSDSWTVMDMALYQALADKTSQTTTEARQNALNLIISAAAGSDASVSDRARMEIVLRAMGVDSTKLYPVNGNSAVNNGAKLAEMDLSSGGYYAAPWILLADMQGNLKLSQDQTDSLITLLKANMGDGLFGYEWGGISYTDPDTACAALSALARFDSADAREIKATVLKALPGAMDASGSLGNANSDAMAIIGLIAVGQDPAKLKAESGASIVDGLMCHVNAEKTGFTYAGKNDALATEQGFRALVALAMFQGEAVNIYDFGGNAVQPGRATGAGETVKPSEPSGSETITVSFSLEAGNEVWIPARTLHLKTGSTVYHAFTQALAAAGIQAVGAESGYVKSITKDGVTLAEFGKGANSGWLYQVNGQSPQVGLTSYMLSEGDVVRWYYSADWTQDPGTGSWGGGEIGDPDVPLGGFIDVTGHWALDAINYVYEKGLMEGTSAITFEPETELTRGMLATILYRMENEPEVNSDMAYTDVASDSWYEKAVLWGTSNGLLKGYGDGTFRPENIISREEAATLLLRYAEFKKLDTGKRNDLRGFVDAASVSDWAEDGLSWAVGAGLVGGKENNRLDPLGHATRAEAAMLLMRYCENVK